MISILLEILKLSWMLFILSTLFKRKDSFEIGKGPPLVGCPGSLSQHTLWNTLNFPQFDINPCFSYPLVFQRLFPFELFQRTNPITIYYMRILYHKKSLKLDLYTFAPGHTFKYSHKHETQLTIFALKWSWYKFQKV